MNKMFIKKNRLEFESNVVNALNKANLVSPKLANSPRTVGDAVQDYLGKSFTRLFTNGLLKEYDNNFARRSMEDFAFTDIYDNYYAIDSKTHNIDTHFNMPNLISVKRLAKFYEDYRNYFTILLTSYSVPENGRPVFKECNFIPIEMLDWNCLTLGALGTGQIQIRNSNLIIINEKNTRKKWMLELCDILDEFYNTEIGKINSRLGYFRDIREFWENQPDA